MQFANYIPAGRADREPAPDHPAQGQRAIGPYVPLYLAGHGACRSGVFRNHAIIVSVHQDLGMAFNHWTHQFADKTGD